MSFKDIKHKPINCKYCGKEFVPVSHKNLYCSKDCHRMWLKEVTWKNKKKKPKKKKSNQEVIVDVAKEAKANGMSYGQWVALLYQQSNKKG